MNGVDLSWGGPRWGRRSLLVAIVTAGALLIATMSFIAGDPSAYISELRETTAIGIDPSHAFRESIRWNSPHVDTRWRLAFGGTSLLLFVILRFANDKWADQLSRWRVWGLSCMLLGLGAFGLVAVWLDVSNILCWIPRASTR